MEREVPARGVDRSGQRRGSCGASATTSRRSITSPSGRPHKATSPNPQLPARFRERTPAFHGLETGGTWSYYENPFVGTRQLNGLLTVHAMLGNSDLKDAQNALYTLKEPVEGARRWFVARDLGQTFGRTGALDPPRGDPDVFDETGFITGVEKRRTSASTTAAATRRCSSRSRRPTCAGCASGCRALSDAQLQDAFRAGGYPRATADRFIRRLEQKIAEGAPAEGLTRLTRLTVPVRLALLLLLFAVPVAAGCPIAQDPRDPAAQAGTRAGTQRAPTPTTTRRTRSTRSTMR